MTNNRPDDNRPAEPRTPEEFARLFNAIVEAQDHPLEYDFIGTLWCVEKDMPVSGIKAGLAWLGEAPHQFKDMQSLRKAAKDFRFYFDQTPRICLCIGSAKQGTKKRRKAEFREVLYLGTIPWAVLDEL